MTPIFAVTFVMSAVLICKWTLSHSDDDDDDNRKRVCNFLLVRHGNVGPILHRFRDIADFYTHDPTPIPP